MLSMIHTSELHKLLIILQIVHKFFLHITFDTPSKYM